MAYKIEDIKNILSTFPRQKLGFFPTHLQKMERVSREQGVNVYLKREDLSGVSVFGGNKIRKLEYLIGDAVSKKCSKVITYGATQSNHAMQTVTACRSCGLDPVLILASIVEPDLDDLRSNFLLDYTMGADVRIISSKGEPLAELMQRLSQEGKTYLEDLGDQADSCYDIPGGGNNEIGALGFLGGFVEIAEQMELLDSSPDYICHATGTGGTLAGLAIGRKLLGAENTKIISYAVAEMNGEYEKGIAQIANKTMKLMGLKSEIAAEELNIDRNYVGPGYEVPSEAGNDALRYLARTEGILLDPVYSGKGFAGMLDNIKSGVIPQGSSVVFIHTGGATALFAEKEIIGDVARK